MSVTRTPLRNESLRREEEARGFIRPPVEHDADDPSTVLIKLLVAAGLIMMGVGVWLQVFAK